MTEHELLFSFLARYYKTGLITPTTKKVWFVLHGYGQLAQYFIKKFKILSDHNICVIAPEGLSRFYIEDVTKRSQNKDNRVGASWMTREYRLTDIQNYITYLNSIYTKEIEDRKDIEVTILGFSQGAATASRWILDNTVHFDRLILWAGIFPDDMDFKKASDLLCSKKVEFIYGTHDQFITEERLTHINKLMMSLNLNIPIVTFNGTHEIDVSTLQRLI